LREATLDARKAIVDRGFLELALSGTAQDEGVLAPNGRRDELDLDTLAHSLPITVQQILLDLAQQRAWRTDELVAGVLSQSFKVLLAGHTTIEDPPHARHKSRSSEEPSSVGGRRANKMATAAPIVTATMVAASHTTTLRARVRGNREGTVAVVN
jgi:hypothetical protein